MLEKARLIEAHQPHWSSAWTWLGFFVALCLSELFLFQAWVQGWYWLVVPALLVTAHLMHANLVAFHEAAHGTLCPHRRVNDGVGLLLGTLGLMGFSLYRAAHHSHHAYLATQRDEELWPFVLPGTPRWARWLAAVAELSLGIVYTPLLFLRTFLRRGSPIRSPRLRRRIWAEFALIGVVWCGIVTATAWWGVWPFLLVLYIIPGILAGNLQSLRKYIEHMGLTGATVLGTTRSVVARGPLGRLVAFSLFNVSYHGVHHQYAKMPQAAMSDFTRTLEPVQADELAPFPSYRLALWDMVRSLGDPRIGAQWRDGSSGLARTSIGRKTSVSERHEGLEGIEPEVNSVGGAGT